MRLRSLPSPLPPAHLSCEILHHSTSFTLHPINSVKCHGSRPSAIHPRLTIPTIITHPGGPSPPSHSTIHTTLTSQMDEPGRGKPRFRKFYAICLHEFQSEERSELAIQPGDILRILRTGDSGWWCAQSREGRGWVPSVFVHRIGDDLAQMMSFLGEELRFPGAQTEEAEIRKEITSPIASSSLTRSPSTSTGNEEAPVIRMERHPYARSGSTDSQVSQFEGQRTRTPREVAQKVSHGRRATESSTDSSLKDNELPNVTTVKRLIIHISNLPMLSEEGTDLQHVLLSTYHLFISAEGLLDLLIATYNVGITPSALSKVDLWKWESEVKAPTQNAILSILSDWILKYHLLEDAPHLMPVILSYLEAASLRFGRDHIRRSLEKILMGPPSEDHLSFTRLRRKWNGFKIHPPTPREFAEQLTYYESRLFCAIRSRELLGWLKCHTSKDVQNLSKFVATCDRLADWVKESILREAGVVQRAEAIQRWIIVADNCCQLRNFSSMFAIIAALCSTAVDKLTHTWKYVTNRPRLTSLSEIISGTRNFRTYREMLAAADGPCVPFIGPHLRDMIHISDAFGSTVIQQAGLGEAEGQTEVNVKKCSRLVQVMDSALRHQTQTYDIQGMPRVLAYIESRLQRHYPDDWFDRRCKDILALEAQVDPAPPTRLVID